MYGLVKGTDVSFLSGAELEQVCIGLYQVILNFDKGVSISLECKYQVNGKVGDVIGLVQLLGHRILVPMNEGGGEIILQFTNGGVVIIHDSNLDAESYQITAPGKQIIV